VKITELKLAQFRNHFSTKFETFGRGLVLLRGPNGAGKTSVLEAIHLLSTGIGIKARRDSDFMHFNGAGYRVDATLDSGRTYSLRCESGGKREAFEDGVAVPRSSALVGRVRMVLLRPDDIVLLEGAPEARRRFFDIMLSLADPAYFSALKRFTRAVKQAQRVEPWERRVAVPFHELMRIEMPALFAARASACRRVQESVNRMMLSLGYGGTVEVEYRPAIPSGASESDWNAAAARCVEEGSKLEEAGSWNPFGPHRDECIFRLDGVGLRQFGSQGQKRAVALCLRLAEAEILSRAIQAAGGSGGGDEGAIVLLDDVLGELDAARVEGILTLLKGLHGQVWAAGTTTSAYEERWKEWVRFDIKAGALLGAETQ
jgi:DNA replication and repair protein RecF